MNVQTAMEKGVGGATAITVTGLSNGFLSKCQKV